MLLNHFGKHAADKKIVRAQAGLPDREIEALLQGKAVG